MSVNILSRQRGAIIKCNRCGQTLTTGQIKVKIIRSYAKSIGWIRGLLKRSTGSSETETGERANGRHDLCPACAPAEKQRAEDRKAVADARRAARTARVRLTSEQKREARNKRARERRAAKKQVPAAAA